MARVTTWDGKVYDVPNENVNAFLEQYNSDTNYTYKSPNPEVNQERGANLGGVVRAGLQGIPAVGSYADEAEAGVRAAGDALVQEMMYQQEHRNDPKPTPQIPGLAGQFIQGVQNFQDTQKRYNEAYNKSYDKYLKNARESFEGALENIPEYAYPAYIGTGIAGEAALAALTGGASLTPAAQGAMGAVYGYGMGEGIGNRAIDAGIVGIASAALPAVGKYAVKSGKAVVDKGVNKVGEWLLKKKIPNTVETLKKMTPVLGRNTSDKVDVNILSSLMGGAGDYATQAKVATELVKETPKNAGLYKSEIMEGVNELANMGWKKQVAGAIEDVGLDIDKPARIKSLEKLAENTKDVKVKNSLNAIIKKLKNDLSDEAVEVINKDKQILSNITNKLSQATKTTIESADNALEEVELKNVREIVNYAIDKFGKGLSKETRDLLEKRMISEGMAKRVSNKLVGKPLAESAKKTVFGELTKDALTGVIANALLPGSGAIAALGRNVLRGGTSGAIGKVMTDKTAATAAKSSVDKISEKGINGALLKTLAVEPEQLSPRIIEAGEKVIKNAAEPEIIKKWYLTPVKNSIITNPIIKSLAQ